MKKEEIISNPLFFSENLRSIGNINFTHREIDIISFIVNGRSTKKIATFLSISPKTVENYIRNIMLKLECNSRESIIDFIEHSNRLPLARKHHTNLLIQIEFEKCLIEISKFISKLSPFSIVIYGDKQDFQSQFFTFLNISLKKAGIKSSLKVKDPSLPFHIIKDEGVIYFLSKTEENSSQEIESLLKFFEHHGVSTKHRLCFVLQGFKDKVLFSQTLNETHFIDITGIDSWYFLFFDALKDLYLTKKIGEIIKEFKKQYNYLQQMIQLHPQLFLETGKKNAKKHKEGRYLYTKNLAMIFILIVGFLGAGFSILKNTNGGLFRQQTTEFIIPDLFIPSEAVLLVRPALIQEIDRNFEQSEGIQTVALTGIGGAGKTILARQYAHLKKFQFVWEINAETPNSLRESFGGLACSLAKTKEDLKILKNLEELKNVENKEEGIKKFIQEKLKDINDWFLIYDNVEKFSDIRKYFPQNSHIWGQGKVLITTRDINIQNNKLINAVLYIGELNKEEMFTLFAKIMGKQNGQKLPQKKVKAIKKFLEEIPPFPLDISVAAYYLNATKISYDKYLSYISENKKELENAQRDIVKELVNYNKTRHSIVALSLQQLIKEHADFADLLLFISFLDSQKIHKDLLAAFKKEIIVDNFIYNLKKYSLAKEDVLIPSQSSSAFSIHRNMQEIFLDYLINTFEIQQFNASLGKITHTFDRYIERIIETEDFSKIKFLIGHCEKFLSHKKFLDQEICPSIIGKLGFIYAENGEYIKGRQLLERNLEILKNNYPKNRLNIAKHLTYLGSIYRILGNYERAQKMLEEASFLYKKYFPNPYDNLTHVLMHLGAIYKESGNYKKAKSLLEETLLNEKSHSFTNKITKAWGLTFLGNVYNALGEYEKAKRVLQQSTLNYKNNFPENNRDFARALTHLGNSYRGLGFYNKAKDVLENSYAVHRKLFGEDNIRTSWVLSHLGNTYRELGYYEDAKKALTKSLAIHKSHFRGSHQRIAGLFSSLGSVYLCLGNHLSAKTFLKDSYNIYEEQYGSDHIEIARILGIFAKLYHEEGNMELAEAALQKSLKIFQKQEHPDRYAILENLSDIHMKKSMLKLKRGDVQCAAYHKEQAVNCLNQALLIVQKHMSQDCPHFMRIQSKLKEANK